MVKKKQKHLPNEIHQVENFYCLSKYYYRKKQYMLEYVYRFVILTRSCDPS